MSNLLAQAKFGPRNGTGIGQMVLAKLGGPQKKRVAKIGTDKSRNGNPKGGPMVNNTGPRVGHTSFQHGPTAVTSDPISQT